MVPRDAPDLECLVEILQFLDDGDQQHDDGGGDVEAGGGRGEDVVARSSMVSWCRGSQVGRDAFEMKLWKKMNARPQQIYWIGLF